MSEDRTMPQAVTDAFMRKLTAGRDSIRSVAYLCVVGGVFALVFTLLSAHNMGLAVITLQRASFLVGGAIAFAIGIGLLNYSDGARSAGAQWLLAWGVLELIAGGVSIQGDMPIGIFCVVAGLLQLMFARVLRQPAEIFVTMVGADFSNVMLEEALLKASEIKQPAMQAFLKTALYDEPPVNQDIA